VKGFFGSLSSFFLTPTESDKMVRKWLCYWIKL